MDRPRRRISISPIRSTTACWAIRIIAQVNADVTADLVIGQPDLINSSGELPEQQPDANQRARAMVARGAGGGRERQPLRRRHLQCARGAVSRAIRKPDRRPDCRRRIWFWARPALVGQPIKDVSAQTMSSAYGLAFTAAGDLVVSDPAGESCSLFPEDRQRRFSIRRSRQQRFRPAGFQLVASERFWRARI